MDHAGAKRSLAIPFQFGSAQELGRALVVVGVVGTAEEFDFD